ncbi:MULTISPECIES: cytochrome P450 [Rhodococcus]|uniref:cytochrome P450 n=2 Tax=Nocardiaceae TaxID=85025 RepID=UPI0007EAF27E|nr:cytochrome [Rhodococcus sp. 852002-51564_SCH6189132-a]
MTVTATFPMPRDRQRPLDPPPAYRELAATSRVPLVQTPSGPAWLVAHHDDCRTVLTDRSFSSDPRTSGYPSYISGGITPPPGYFLMFDQPDHTRLRRLVTREFVIGRMEQLRPRVNEVINEALDKMMASEDRRGDIVTDIAFPVASTMICELLDVPVEDQGTFIGLTDTILDRSTPPDEAAVAVRDLMAYFGDLVRRKKKHVKDDLFGRLIEHERTGTITEGELIGLAALLVLSGYDTMAQTIGLGALLLLTHPDQLRSLVDDPKRAAQTVEEMLRYLSINHAGLPRAATEDRVIGGQAIRAGDGVLVMLNAANRDTNVFEDADRFDISRPQLGSHIAFGHGFHKCIGLTMARVELSEVFTVMAERLPEMQLTGEIASLTFRDDMVLYGACSVPVAW